MSDKNPFANLTKINAKTAVEVVRFGKLKFNTEITTKADDPVAKLIEELVAQNLMMDALKVLALALPGRESVWWGCLAVRDHAKDGKKSKALEAAEGWVFKPTAESKSKMRKFFEEPGGLDALMCEAACAVPMPDDEEPVVTPPHMPGMFVFKAQIKSFFQPDDPEEIALRGQLLLSRGLDIAKGGSGQVDAAKVKENNAIGEGKEAG